MRKYRKQTNATRKIHARDRLFIRTQFTESSMEMTKWLVYVTPEYSIGVNEQAIGCIDMLRESADKLALIVIDECHKIFERSGSFR